MKSFAAHVGPLMGNTAGRADKLKTTVPEGSHVIPADTVAALGGGNSLAGHQELMKMFPKSKSPKPRKPGAPRLKFAGGGPVNIMASDGEFVVSPEDVVTLGEGNPQTGHDILDSLIRQVRDQHIKKLKSIPDPKK